MGLIGGAAALAVALVLLAAGLGHVRDPRALRTALAAHRVLPSGLQPLTASALAPLELALGGALLVALALHVTPAGLAMPTASIALTLAALAATALLTGFTAYLAVVLRRTRGGAQVPCGCGLGATPVGRWAVARAGLLSGLGLLATGAAVGDGGVLLPTEDAPVAAQLAVLLAAGLTLALTTAALPAARALPGALTTLPGGTR